MTQELETKLWKFIGLVAMGNTEISVLEGMADNLLEAKCNEPAERMQSELDKTIHSHNSQRSLIEQLCRDLNGAHDQVLRQQGCKPEDFGKYDWPEWSSQANSIRTAEKLLATKLAKTDAWTVYPTNKTTGALERCPHCGNSRWDDVHMPRSPRVCAHPWHEGLGFSVQTR